MRTSAISVPSHREKQTLPPSCTHTRRVIAGTPRTRPPIHSSGAPYRLPAFHTEPHRPTRTSPLQAHDAVSAPSRYPARETLSTSAGPRPPKPREPPGSEREAPRRAGPRGGRARRSSPIPGPGECSEGRSTVQTDAAADHAPGGRGEAASSIDGSGARVRIDTRPSAPFRCTPR